MQSGGIKLIMLSCSLNIIFQCNEPTALDEVPENASMIAVLTGGCHLASLKEAAIVNTASLNNDLLKVSPVLEV